MARITKPLTDTEISKAKAKDKDYYLYDGDGLCLLIKKNNSKLWRFNYKFNEKRKTISFGKYPETKLKEARELKDKAKNSIKNHINPSESKSSNFELDITFQYISDKWLDLMKNDWTKSNYLKNKGNLNNNAYPFLGNKNIKDITRKDILNLVERMEKRDAIDYAHRLLGVLQRIYKYAVTNEYVEHNIIADIDKQNSLKKRKTINHPAITNINEFTKLLNDIENYGINFKSDISTIYALKLAPFVALRPFNLRSLEWSEVDFDKEILDISSKKMKMDIDFVLPLSKQALKILKEVEQYKTDSKYVFYSAISNQKHISENTINQALQRMGYKNIHTGHGFRSSFSTNCHENITEHGLSSDIIESCLAHAEQNSVKRAYNRESKYKYIDEKRILMQWWSDFLK